VGGLATDYCVVNTVLEGVEAGFSFDVIADGIRGVDAQPRDSDRAIERMKAGGARFV
jgi:nicotinamidase/pyrazinamidase